MPDPKADFLAACVAGDMDRLTGLLAAEPGLVGVRTPEGATPLHLALRHPDAVGLLLRHGADPNARDEGDNALPLHWAAGGAPLETVRELLDAGSDVQGEGDAHRMDVIGWATCFAEPRRDVVDLLVQRGARHHVFSAIALGDVELLRNVITADPAALTRRLSSSEQEQTAVHYVVAPGDGLVGGTFRTGTHYAMLDVLIEQGADLEARDAVGRTPLEVAMLHGDREAMRRLHAAGAKLPESGVVPGSNARIGAASVRDVMPMLAVPDVSSVLAWYEAIGFRVTGRHEGDPGSVDWSSVRFGDAELMFVPARPGASISFAGLSLWFRSDRLDDLHATLRDIQLAHARAELLGDAPATPEVPFKTDLHTAFYGQREFAIRDPNGLELFFYQPLDDG